MIAAWIYSLCAATSLVCATLLLRAYFAGRYRLLLWSALCFCGLALNSVLLVVDKVLLPVEVDLSILRSSVALGSTLLLIYGLVFDRQ